MTLRDDVLTTITLMANSRASDDGEIVGQLVSCGYKPLQAELLVAFVPLGLGRTVIARLPVHPPIHLSDTALILDPSRNEVFDIHLVDVREFESARALGEETFATGIILRGQLDAASSRSVELNVINQALNSGVPIGSAQIESPVLLRLTEAPGFPHWYSELKSRTPPKIPFP